MVTLHAYVLRELLKTFGLTLAALTALFTMGGGLYNVVSYEGFSAADVFRFVPLLIPIVVTLTMPIAALFAVTMVYGRLADDNELVACRAAGVNVHRMFRSAVLLSIFVAVFTLLFGSFIIPRFVGRIEQFARNNIRDLVAQTLQRKGFIHRSRDGADSYTLTAEQVQGVTDEALLTKGFEVGSGLHYLLIRNPTLLHIDEHGALQRFAAAREGMVIFDTRPTPIELTLLVREGRNFEVGKSAVTIRQQQIGPIPMELPARVRMSTAALDDLIRWRASPWLAPRLQDEIRMYRRELLREHLFAWCAERIEAGADIEFPGADERSFLVRASSAERVRSGLRLSDVSVEVQRADAAVQVRYEAAAADLIAADFGLFGLALEIRMLQTEDADVLEYNPRFGDPDTPRRKPTLSVDGPWVPSEVEADLAQFPPSAVLDPNVEMPVPQALADRRISLQNSAKHVQRKITATIHFRSAYTVSVLVTGLMGAALGVIFRGSRALAAVLIAMIPFFSVLILMVLGRHVAEDPATTQYGPLVTWGGLAVVLVADFVILRLGVRR